MSPWHVLNDPKAQRRLGKLGEELGELQAIQSRIGIQGVEGINPENGKVNRQALAEEVADVIAQCYLCIEHFDLPREFVDVRIAEKKVQMTIWDDLVDSDKTTLSGETRFGIGTILRYSDGPTALFRVETVSHTNFDLPRYYGTQCMGGIHGAWHKQCRPASDEDIETWKKKQPNRRFIR